MRWVDPTGSGPHPSEGYGHPMSGPLSGVTVVEACQMVAGPMAAMICADLGAEVVKVEHPFIRNFFLGERGLRALSAAASPVNA